jgi:hypothetical protein
MLKTIGKEWTKKEDGGCFTADHMSQDMIVHNLTLEEVMKGKK